MSASCGQVKYRSSVHVLRSPWPNQLTLFQPGVAHRITIRPPPPSGFLDLPTSLIDRIEKAASYSHIYSQFLFHFSSLCVVRPHVFLYIARPMFFLQKNIHVQFGRNSCSKQFVCQRTTVVIRRLMRVQDFITRTVSCWPARAAREVLQQ